jgi:hypothetical protein
MESGPNQTSFSNKKNPTPQQQRRDSSFTGRTFFGRGGSAAETCVITEDNITFRRDKV